MRKLRAFWLRFFGLLDNRRFNGEIEAELESHISMHIEDGVRTGLTREEARRRALIRLGGAEQTRQAYRDGQRVPQLERLWQDVRFAARVLVKSPGYTLTAALTLALGIGATTAIFSVVKAVLLEPLPYKDPDRLAVVWTASPARGGQPLPSSPGDFAAWKQQSGVFEDLGPSYDYEVTLTGQGAPQFLIGYAVSASYLRILGVQPELGRIFTDGEDIPKGPKVAVVSDQLWRTTLNTDPKIVGKAITLSGDAYTVLGVMPKGFDYPPGVDVWLPIGMAPADLNDFKRTYIRMVGRLKKGVTFAEATKTLNALEAQLAAAHPDTDTGNRVVVVSLREQLDGDIRKPLLVLMGAVLIVLLIASANTAGLALARNTERQKEIAVRMALGATRSRLLCQFGVESLLLAVTGGALGVGLAAAGARFLLALFPNDVANLSIPRVTDIPIDGGVLAFALGITLLTAILFGIAPVIKATRTEADAAMNDTARQGAGTRRRGLSQSVLVVCEISLSLMLLTAAGLFVASFRKVVESSLGFRADHVLSVYVLLPFDRYPFKGEQPKTKLFVQQTVRRMCALPGVSSCGAVNFLPLSGFWGTTTYLKRGQMLSKNVQPPEADDRSITPDYLRTMEIPVVRGRGITEADGVNAEHVILINQTLAHLLYGGRDPLGEELNLATPEKPDWWRIVGVVGDVKAFGQDQRTHAEIYQSFEQSPSPLIAFTLRTQSDPQATMKSAEQAMWSVDPELPVFKSFTMDSLADQSRAVRRASSSLMSAFAGLALLLACIGVYGVMAYSVSRRTREIGVRMALGAKRADVLRMVLGSGMRLALIGIAIGLAGALATSRLLASLLFEMSPFNPLIFGLAAAGLAATAASASLLPARRAASVDPMQALRVE